MRSRKRFFAKWIGWLGLWLTGWLGGCGELPSPEHPGEPLWTLRAKVQGIQEGLDTSDLRVAFFWTRPRNLAQEAVTLIVDPFQFFVADLGTDVNLPPVLDPASPLAFALEFFALPEKEFLAPIPMTGAGQYGLGTMLLYSDQNQNGKLDFLPRGTQAAKDRILGPVETYLLLFLEAPSAATETQIPWKPGLSLHDASHALTTRTSGSSLGSVIGRVGKIAPEDYWSAMLGPQLALDRELAVSLRLDPLKQLWMCQDDLLKDRAENQIGPVEPAAIPAGAKVSCQPGGRSLSFEKTTVSYIVPNCLCCEYNLEVTYGTSSLPEGAGIPFGWPCP